MGFLIFIFVLIVCLICFWITISNKLNVAVVKINEAESGIDIALTKRYDVLMKLADSIKSYTKYEKETLENIIQLRSEMTVTQKQDANKKMSEELSKLNVIVENYPELKASENYQVLQKAILEVEEHLQASRRIYNSNISAFNQMLVTFPSNMVAATAQHVEKDFFEVDEYVLQNIKLDLNL